MFENYAYVTNRLYKQKPIPKPIEETSKLPPIKLESNIKCITTPRGQQILAGITAVHNLDSYVRKPEKLLLLPKVTTPIDLFLEGSVSE